MDDPDTHEKVYQLSRYSPETQLKMKIALFIRHANMNKTNRNALLNLIRGISAIEIPNNCDKFWNDLNVKFSYKTIIYCSSCFKKLQHIKQRCSNHECQNQMHKINSELILFDVADKIRSINIKNYHLIKWYQENLENGPPCDILFGNFYRTKSSKNRLRSMLSTDDKPLTISTNSSTWLVVAALAEIPHPVNPDRLLSCIVHNLMVLQNGGLLIDIGGEGLTRFEVDVLIIGDDLPAHAKLFLLNQWKTIFPKPVHMQMNRFLLSIKYPHTIKRHPVDIESTGKWKATQLHVFLLCIALSFAVHYYIPQPHRRQPPAQTFTQPSTPTPAAVLKKNNVEELRTQQNSMMKVLDKIYEAQLTILSHQKFYNGINLLDSEPAIELTALLCSSIRKLYTNEEIATHTQNDLVEFDDEVVPNHDNNKRNKSCVHNIAEPGVTSLPVQHRHLIDILLDRPTVDGKYRAAVPSQLVSLQIDPSDLDYFYYLLVDSKLEATVNSSETPPRLNSDTMEEMNGIWEYICVVLLSPKQNASFLVSISCLCCAADNINKDPKKDNFIVRNVQVNAQGECRYSTALDQILNEVDLEEDEIENSVSEQNATDETSEKLASYSTFLGRIRYIGRVIS
ncbi:unnamed protein product [Rotaria sordida]|uniref:Uncharacterized protein n=1 Tax=Rotaria sordida TaxID=392033 RepID=A0A813TM06_9BILA|nr:unnamed protein product [Rotaria sordida]CAF1570965.1 unnamed protein product [Rotaria sordida]